MAILITDEDQPGTDSGYTKPFDQMFAYPPNEKGVCDWMNHTPVWCGDCYACAECGRKFEMTKSERIREDNGDRKNVKPTAQGNAEINREHVREANRVAAISEAMHIIRTLNSHKITFNVTFDISFIRFKVIGEHQISRANNLIHTSFEKSYYAERWTGTLNLAW